MPLAPGTWWDYRESWTEDLGGIHSITDADARFEVRRSICPGRWPELERVLLAWSGGEAQNTYNH